MTAGGSALQLASPVFALAEAPRCVAVVLDFARTAPTLSAAKRIKGLTLSATDLDWRTGSGPLIEGPGEALVMALAGRCDGDVVLGRGRGCCGEPG